MLASPEGIDSAIAAVLLACAAMACCTFVAVLSLRRARRSRTRNRWLYRAMAGFALAMFLGNVGALALPLGFWRLTLAYGAFAALILWAMMRFILHARGSTGAHRSDHLRP